MRCILALCGRCVTPAWTGTAGPFSTGIAGPSSCRCPSALAGDTRQNQHWYEPRRRQDQQHRHQFTKNITTLLAKCSTSGTKAQTKVYCRTRLEQWMLIGSHWSRIQSMFPSKDAQHVDLHGVIASIAIEGQDGGQAIQMTSCHYIFSKSFRYSGLLLTEVFVELTVSGRTIRSHSHKLECETTLPAT